jgi:hypothetical protein
LRHSERRGSDVNSMRKLTVSLVFTMISALVSADKVTWIVVA